LENIKEDYYTNLNNKNAAADGEAAKTIEKRNQVEY